MQFFLGDCRLNIIGSRRLINLLPSEWNSYLHFQKDELPQGTLRIEEGLPAKKGACSDGWSLVRTGELQEACYSQGGRPVFSLQYTDPSDCVTVRAPRGQLHDLRLGMLYGSLLALHKECVGLHGVTIQCEGKTIILSAPSGTGKSTLARLLENCGNVRVINGDFALLSLSDDGVMFEPTPFCGTSGICLNERARVDRVVFLEQSETDRMCDMTGRQAVAALMDNTFVPTWSRGLQQTVMGNILGMLSFVKVHSFAFAPDREAARVFLETLIDYRYHNMFDTEVNSKEVKKMDVNKIPVPTSKEEMDELCKQVREEIDLGDLEAVSGGEGESNPPTPWLCPFCGTVVMVRTIKEGQKHMTKCPGNPYKQSN